MPIAYGIVYGEDGEDPILVTGISNVSSVVKDGDYYRISIDGMNDDNHPVMLTSMHPVIDDIQYTSDQIGSFVVALVNDADEVIDSQFSFVVYPDPSAN